MYIRDIETKQLHKDQLPGDHQIAKSFLVNDGIIVADRLSALININGEWETTNRCFVW